MLTAIILCCNSLKFTAEYPNIAYEHDLGNFAATNSQYTFTLNCIATFKCFAYNGDTFGSSFDLEFLPAVASASYLGFGTGYDK